MMATTYCAVSFTADQRHEELALLNAAIAGDKYATRRFFERYNCLIEVCVRKVYRRAGMRVSEEDIRDMVSEVWLSLLDDDKRCLRRFEPGREVRVSTWIGLLARNKTIDRLRTQHGHTISIEEAEEVAECEAPTPQPGEAVEWAELGRYAAIAFQHLKEEDRRFLEAWYADELTPEEVAVRFGIAVGTVYSRRFKIQTKLARAVHRVAASRTRHHTANLTSAALPVTHQ